MLGAFVGQEVMLQRVGNYAIAPIAIGAQVTNLPDKIILFQGGTVCRPRSL